jgi:hypothetical protein
LGRYRSEDTPGDQHFWRSGKEPAVDRTLVRSASADSSNHTLEDRQAEFRRRVVSNLARGGNACRNAADYLIRNDTRIGFSRQVGTGARWTAGGDIELNSKSFSPDGDPGDPRLLAAVVEEAKHLEQGPALALTVKGEVKGWQARAAAWEELVGNKVTGRYWRIVIGTPENPSPEDLRRARAAIRAIVRTPHYMIWALALQPNWVTRLIEKALKR